MESRRNLFKTSILSAFGLMSGASVVQAAATAGHHKDSCTGENPILVRPDKGDPVLLVPRADGKVEAVYVKSNSGASPLVSPLRLQDLLDPKQYSTSPVNEDVIVHGKPIKIKHGFLDVPLNEIKTPELGFTEVTFGEIYWFESGGHH